MAAINLAKLKVILKISMKHGMFGIKFDGMKHRIRRDVVKLESIRIRSKVKVLSGQEKMTAISHNLKIKA